MDDYKVVLNIIKEEYGEEDSSNIYVFLPKPNKNYLTFTNISNILDESCNKKFLRHYKSILLTEDKNVRQSLKSK